MTDMGERGATPSGLGAAAPCARGGTRARQADHIGRLLPGFAVDVLSLDVRDRLHITHRLAGAAVYTLIEGGAVVFRRTAYSL